MSHKCGQCRNVTSHISLRFCPHHFQCLRKKNNAKRILTFNEYRPTLLISSSAELSKLDEYVSNLSAAVRIDDLSFDLHHKFLGNQVILNKSAPELFNPHRFVLLPAAALCPVLRVRCPDILLTCHFLACVNSPKLDLRFVSLISWQLQHFVCFCRSTQREKKTKRKRSQSSQTEKRRKGIWQRPRSSFGQKEASGNDGLCLLFILWKLTISLSDVTLDRF